MKYKPLSKKELEAIGDRIREYQKYKGYSNKQVADHLNIAESTYRNLLRGRSLMNISYLRAICEFLACDYDYIMRGTQEDSADDLANKAQVYLAELSRRAAELEK